MPDHQCAEHGALMKLLGGIDARLQGISERQEKMETKLDGISDTVSRSKGAGWALMRVGGALTAIAGGGFAVWKFLKGGG